VLVRILGRVKAYAQVVPAARRNRTDLLRWMVRRPQLLAGLGAYEAGLFSSARVEDRLRGLAQLRVSSLIGCLF
jgi:hypothetical protein